MMMAWQNTPIQAIFLRKGPSDRGACPEGKLFKYTYKSLDPMTALARAHKRLKAEKPDENPLAWTLVNDG